MAKYRKGRKIAEGGFGAVFHATCDIRTGPLALKETKESATEEEVKRFRREVRMQTQLAHANIMQIIAYNLESESPCFLMPLADGSLRDRLPQISNDPDAVDVFLQVCAGVAHAHRQGVIHRDLKPENILFVDGVPKVSDFGIGREMDRESTTITQSNAKLGTVAYMAPEQMTDAKSVDLRADVYALGKILYECLTGRLPFPYMDPSSLSGGFRYIVERATALDPEKRFATVDDLINEVTLLSENKENVLPVIVAAQRLVDAASANPTDQNTLDLVKLFIDNADDAQLFQQVIPRLPNQVVSAAVRYHGTLFCGVVAQFCVHVSGGLAFAYVDIVADFLVSAFGLCNNLETKRAIATRLLAIGPMHNRWHVRDVVRDLLTRLKSEDDVMVFRDACKECSEDLSWFEASSNPAIPQVLRDAFAQPRNSEEANPFDFLWSE